MANGIVSHLDWLPTLLSAAGEPDMKEKLLGGHEAAGKTFNVHLDGYDLLPYLTGEAAESPRTEFFYFSDDGDLVAMRYDNWKLVFMEQRVTGHPAGVVRAVRAAAGAEAVQPAHRPVRAGRRDVEHLLGLVPRPRLRRPCRRSRSSSEFLGTFLAYPPRMKAASFTIDQVQAKLEAAIAAGH